MARVFSFVLVAALLFVVPASVWAEDGPEGAQKIEHIRKLLELSGAAKL